MSNKFIEPVILSVDKPVDELRFIYMTDLHLNHVKPQSRKDDYPHAILEKLSNIAAIASAYKVDFVLCGGDLFHLKAQTDQYMVEVIHTLREFTCPIYTILGNHDIYYSRSDTIGRTPLGICLSSGVIQRLGHLDYKVGNNKVSIIGLDFCLNPVLPLRPLDTVFSFVVAHQFMPGVLEEFVPDEGLTKEDIERTGHNYILGGHDHSHYPNHTIGTTQIIRPGAISRGTKAVSNRFRDVCIDIFAITDGIQILEEKLPVKPPQDVFSEEEIQKDSLSKKITDFVRSLKTGTKENPQINLSTLIAKKCEGNPELHTYVRSFFVNHGLV